MLSWEVGCDIKNHLFSDLIGFSIKLFGIVYRDIHTVLAAVHECFLPSNWMYIYGYHQPDCQHLEEIIS